MPTDSAASARPTGVELRRTWSNSRLRIGSSSEANRRTASSMSRGSGTRTTLTPIRLDKSVQSVVPSCQLPLFLEEGSINAKRCYFAAPVRRPPPRGAQWRDPRVQAYSLLRTGFAVAPILFGLDKFFDILVDWPKYLAPWVNDIAPGSADDFMYFVGGVEIVAGLVVALKPRYGAYLAAGWLGGIILNLLTHSGYYDIALRDFGLLIGALALGRLAAAYDPPLRLTR